jgi:hypothetical protein
MRANWLRAILALLLILALLPGTVLADNDSPEAAILLTPAVPSASGALTGNPGGAFRYFRIEYPGAETPVTVRLTWDPGWGVTDAAFGFKVWGPNGQVGEGQHSDDQGSSSAAQVTFSAAAPAGYLIQVYSYTRGSTSNFTVEVKGLGEPVAVVNINTSPEQAVTVPQAAFLATGQLEGGSSGSYRYFNVEYPGGDSLMGISLTVSPGNWLDTNAYGINVYESGTLIAAGDEIAHTQAEATKTCPVRRAAPGSFVVQIYNYATGITADYALGVSGAVPEIKPAVGSDSPSTAPQFTAPVSAYHGTLTGLADGAFAYFVMPYQGWYEPVTVVLSTKPGPSHTYGGVGVKIYHGADPAGDAPTSTGATVDTGLALHTLESTDGGWYGVIVYNYVQDVTVEYTVYVVGLK